MKGERLASVGLASGGLCKRLEAKEGGRNCIDIYGFLEIRYPDSCIDIEIFRY